MMLSLIPTSVCILCALQIYLYLQILQTFIYLQIFFIYIYRITDIFIFTDFSVLPPQKWGLLRFFGQALDSTFNKSILSKAAAAAMGWPFHHSQPVSCQALLSSLAAGSSFLPALLFFPHDFIWKQKETTSCHWTSIRHNYYSYVLPTTVNVITMWGSQIPSLQECHMRMS